MDIRDRPHAVGVVASARGDAGLAAGAVVDLADLALGPVVEGHLRGPVAAVHREARVVHLARERLLDRAIDDLRLGGFVQLDTNTNWSAGQKQVRTEFLHDPIFPDPGPRVGVRLTEALEKAQHSIVLESPYFVPSRALLRLLDRKCAEAVQVMVVTNSITSNDGILPYVAYLKYRRHLARSGVDLREFKGHDCLHAKSAVIDGHLALVGSYNIDPRSENLNTEVMSVADDQDVAGQLLAAIDSHAAQSWQIAARRERVRPTRAMSIRMWAARMLLPFVEGQL